MIQNPVQFAVVREDPEVEISILKQHSNQKRALLVGSGGCTVLTLRALFPQTQICILEPNPNQVDLIEKKLSILNCATQSDLNHHFSIGSENTSSLASCGNFESLFRGFRNFIFEFVYEYKAWLSLFSGNVENRDPIIQKIVQSKYWPVAFDLFFSDSLLRCMFGEQAVQHAPPGSYPFHFKRVLENGLKHPKMHQNYFLHHIFLGHYLDQLESLPLYLQNHSATFSNDPGHSLAFQYLRCFAEDVSDFGGFDLVSLSNIFDWMGEDQVHKVAQKLSQELSSGSWIVFRQLNHHKDFKNYFGNEIEFDDTLALELHKKDRSLFYSQLTLGRKK
jgi:S-adenosylmethionine-diacylglycerol 3-amino-3-carboxypropyl transferase